MFALVVLAILALAAPPALAQGSFNCTLLAHIDSLPGTGNDVWGYTDPATGDEYAIIGTSFGTGIYNVTKPAAPRITGFIPGPQSDWRDFDSYRSTLYAVSEGNGPNEGLQIIDLSNPESPLLVRSLTSAFMTAHSVSVDTARARLYASGARSPDGMHILDLSADPQNPVPLGTYSDAYVHDVTVRNDTAYASLIGIDKTVILDVSDPAAIETLAELAAPEGEDHQAWPTDDRRYLFTTHEIPGSHLRTWDMQDLSSIISVDEFQATPTSSVHNVYLRGNTAFVSYYTEGLQVLDVTDPTRMIPVGWFDTYVGPGVFEGNWSAFPFTPSGNVYLGDIQGGLFIVSFDGTPSGALTGTVTELGTGAPLDTVLIELVEARRSVRTDAFGRYEIRTAAGSHTVRASRLGLISTTFQASVDSGPSTTRDFTMLDNTADIELSQTDSIHVTVAAGSAKTMPLRITNVGGGLLTYSIRDETFLSSVIDKRRTLSVGWDEARRRIGEHAGAIRALAAAKGEAGASARSAAATLARKAPALRRILADPIGDVIPLSEAPAPQVDLVSLHAGVDGDSLLFRIEVPPTLPESVAAIVFFDLDQDASTGVANPISSTLGPPLDVLENDIGADLILVWDLAGRFASPVPGTAFLLTADFSFLGIYFGEVDSTGATIALDLKTDLGDDGNINVVAGVGVVTYLPEPPFIDFLNLDAGPDSGHAIIGTEPGDAPWLVATPDTGSLGAAASDTLALRFDAAAITADTTVTGTLFVETNDEDELVTRIPVSMRVFIPDGTPPGVTISILQNPILSSRAEIVALANEVLAGVPSLTVGGAALALDGDPAVAPPTFRAALALSGSRTVELSLAAEDTAGNQTTVTETFVVYVTQAEGLARADGPSGTLAMTAPEGAIAPGTTLVLRSLSEGRAFVGPEALALAAPVGIELALAPDGARGTAPDGGATAGFRPILYRIGGARDVALPTWVSADGRSLVAESDRLGTFEVRWESGAPAERLADRARLGLASPNPAAHGASLAFALPRRESVRLAVFDITGRLVRSLVARSLEPGPHAVAWDGTDDRGRAVGAGTYFYRLETSDHVEARKVTVIR